MRPQFVVFTTRLSSGFGLFLSGNKIKKMKTSIWKSICAVFAGLIFIGVTHSGTDAILESTGVLPKGHLNVSSSLILVVILYRVVLSFFGCYITALLAPENPMKHSIILGAIGTLLSLVGAIVTANMNIAPLWYGWALVVTALPVAWLAGRIYSRKNVRVTHI